MLVCGAEKTEIAYFRGLRASLGARSIDIKFVERPRSPDQVVEFARDHCAREDFDETWCVVDVDHYELEGSKITVAGAIASRASIQLAVSNPCFEYWLLLHHVDTTAPFRSCDAINARLRKYVKDYDKTKLRYSDFAGGVKVALERASMRDPTGKNYSVNPSSGVWVLVTAMIGQRQ
jgi:hypothetical protein